MGHKWLNQKLSEHTSHSLDFLVLASPSLNPGSCLGPSLVQGQQATLPSPLDQLIWLCDEFCAGGKEPWVSGLGLVQNGLYRLVFREIEGGQFWRRVVDTRRLQRSRLDEGSASKVVVENGLAVGLENGFG